MDRTILTWNIPNFISVGLMVVVLGALLSFAAKSVRTAQQAA